MKDLLYKYFDNNKIAELGDKKSLIEYIKDERTHELFLIILSRLRTNNRFCREKPLIELLSKILIMILGQAQKTNNYSATKNCISLSQSFYYNDESQPSKKVYIFDYIKKYPWFKSRDFWKDYILTMILKKFKQLEDMNIEENINIEKKN